MCYNKKYCLYETSTAGIEWGKRRHKDDIDDKSWIKFITNSGGSVY